MTRKGGLCELRGCGCLLLTLVREERYMKGRKEEGVGGSGREGEGGVRMEEKKEGKRDRWWRRMGGKGWLPPYYLCLPGILQHAGLVRLVCGIKEGREEGRKR